MGAVTQASAALEAEISEVLMHGPGHHQGSNGINETARDFLLPLADTIDRQPTLRRYEIVLHLLRMPVIERDVEPYSLADLLIRLRNELIHYKSKWGEQMDGPKLFTRLEQLGFDKPAFMSPDTIFFRTVA